MRRVIGGVMLFHYLWAQNLVMDNENQGFSEQNNPTGNYQKWFAPIEQNGQTYRRNQITIRTDFDGLALGGYSEYYWVNVEEFLIMQLEDIRKAKQVPMIMGWIFMGRFLGLFQVIAKMV